MNDKDCLGLCIAWKQTRGGVYVLQIMFGITGSPISTYLRFSCLTLILLLQGHPHSKIKLPRKKIEEYKAVIQQHHPLLTNLWSHWMDYNNTTSNRSQQNSEQVLHQVETRSLCVWCICCLSRWNNCGMLLQPTG
jgi:hypothetical protein